MQKTHTRTIITVGVVLALSQIIGIPLLWKLWFSAAIGLFFIGWGLYLRYGDRAPHGQLHDDTHTAQ